MKEKYFRILDLPNGADEEAIKKAYRRKAKKYHPDLNQGKDTTQDFLRIKEAYQILIGEKKAPEEEDLYQIFQERMRRQQQEEARRQQEAHQQQYRRRRRTTYDREEFLRQHAERARAEREKVLKDYQKVYRFSRYFFLFFALHLSVLSVDYFLFRTVKPDLCTEAKFDLRSAQYGLIRGEFYFKDTERLEGYIFKKEFAAFKLASDRIHRAEVSVTPMLKKPTDARVYLDSGMTVTFMVTNTIYEYGWFLVICGVFLLIYFLIPPDKEVKMNVWILCVLAGLIYFIVLLVF